MAEIVFLPGQNRGKTFPEEPLNVGDEIRDANVVRLWRDPATGLWHGLLGPADGNGLMVERLTPSETLIALAFQTRWNGWPFDQSAPGPDFDRETMIL